MIRKERREEARAIFLAAIVVASMIGVGFTGSVAADVTEDGDIITVDGGGGNLSDALAQNATDGDTIVVNDSLEYNPITIDTPDVTVTSASDADPVINGSGVLAAVDIEANGTTFDGFEVIGDNVTKDGIAISGGDRSDVTVTNNNVRGIAGVESPSDGAVNASYAIHNFGGSLSGVIVSDNEIDDIGNTTYNDSSPQAISLGPFDGDTTEVTGNTITNLESEDGNEYGILLYDDDGSVANVDVTENDIGDAQFDVYSYGSSSANLNGETETDAKIASLYESNTNFVNVSVDGKDVTDSAGQPNVTDARLLDTNDDGDIETVDVTLNEPVDDESLTASDFIIDGQTFNNVSTGDTAYDNEFTLILDGANAIDGTAKVSFKTDLVETETTDLAGNGVNPVDQSNVVDSAGPVVDDVTFSPSVINRSNFGDDTTVTVDFSEPVNQTGSGTLALTPSLSGNLMVQDVNGDVVTAQTSLTPTSSTDTFLDLNISGAFEDEASSANALVEFNDSDSEEGQDIYQVDLVRPDLSSDTVTTIDSDSDGTVDQLEVEFNDNIDDASVQDAIDAGDITVDNATITGFDTGETADDDIVNVTVDGLAEDDTSVTPNVTVAADSIEDTAGNPGPADDTTQQSEDGAGPVVSDLTVNGSDSATFNASDIDASGDAEINATFTENVTSGTTDVSVVAPDGTNIDTVGGVDASDGDISVIADLSSLDVDETDYFVEVDGGSDAAGNGLDTFNESRITVDTQAPGVTVDLPTAIQDGTIDISDNLTVTDAGTTERQFAVNRSGNASGTFEEIDINEENFDTSRFDDGTIALRLTATDAAGNENSANDTLQVDNNAPEVAIEAPAETVLRPTSGTLDVDLDVSERNLDTVDITLDTRTDSTSVPRVTADPTDTGADATHTAVFEAADNEDGSSLGNIRVDYTAGVNPSTNVDASDVTQSDVTVSVNDSDVTDEVDGVGTSNEGSTLDISLNDSTSLTAGEKIEVTIDNVTNSDGPTDVGLQANQQSTGNDEPAVTRLDYEAGNAASVSYNDVSLDGDDDVTIALNNSVSATADGAETPDEIVGAGFTTQELYDLSVNVTDQTGKEGSASQADALLIDNTGPENIEIIEPGVADEEYETGDQLQVAYSYTENGTGDVVVQLTQDGVVEAETTVDESEYVNDGVVKSFALDLFDSFDDDSTLDDGRYNVTLIATDSAGNTDSASTDNAPVAINNDEPTATPNFDEGPTASAAVNESEEQVTVDVSYNVSVPDVEDNGSLTDFDSSLDTVEIDSDDGLVDLSVEYYDESEDAYVTESATTNVSDTNDSPTEGENVTETFTLDAAALVADQTGLADEDRVLDYSATVNGDVTVTATSNTDDSTDADDGVDASATFLNQDALEPQIESVEVVGPDVDDTSDELRVTFTRPVEGVASADDFGYQDVSGDGDNFVESASGSDDGDTTLTVTLDGAVTEGDIGEDILDIQPDVVHNPTSGLNAPADSATINETTAPEIASESLGDNASTVTITFDQPVVGADGEALSDANASYSGAANVTGVEHDAETDTATVLLDADVADDEVGSETVTFDAVSDRFDNTAENLSVTVGDDTDPSEINVVEPSDQTVRQSDGLLDVTYNYTENVPDNTESLTITLEGEDDTDYVYEIDDSQYVDGAVEKSVTLDLDSVVGDDAQLSDGTYDLTIEAEDGAGNDNSVTEEGLVVIDDDAPEVTNVAVENDQPVGPEDDVNVSFDYADATDASSVTVHIVESDDTDEFTAGDFENATFSQVPVTSGLDDGEVTVDLSTLENVVDSEDYTVYVTATDSSGNTNLNTSANPIIQQDSDISSASLDVNGDVAVIENVEADAGLDTVEVEFSEDVVASSGDGFTRADFAYQDVSGDGAGSIEGVDSHDGDTVTLRLDSEVSANDLGSDLINAISDRIEDEAGAAVDTSAVTLTDTMDPTVGDVAAADVNADNADSYDVTVDTTAEVTDVTVTVSGSENETVTATADAVQGDEPFTLDVSALADGEVSVDVELTDAADNDASSSSTVEKDTVAPEIDSATTNAGTDAVDVMFTESVENVGPSSFDVTSPVHEVEETTRLEGDVVRLTLNATVPPGAIDNGTIAEVRAPGVTDSVGNDVSNDVNFTDVEAPSIVDAAAERGDASVSVTFSEFIPEQNLTAENFTYTDTNNASAGSIENITREGDRTYVLSLDESLTPEDLEQDEVGVSADTLADEAGNLADEQSVPLGFTESISATAEESTVTIQVVTTANISDVADDISLSDQNSEFTQVQGFEVTEPFERDLEPSDFEETESGVYEATVEVPEDDAYSVTGFAGGTEAVVDTETPQPTNAAILEVTDDAQLDDTRDTTRVRVLFNEPIDAAGISPDDVSIDGFDGEIVEVQDSGAFGAIEVIVEGQIQTGTSPDVTVAGSSYTDLAGTAGVDEGSTVVHTDELDLDEGVNFVSVPAASGGLDIDELPVEDIVSINRYDSESGEFETYVPGAPGNAFDELQGGDGYIIRMDADATVPINVNNVPSGQNGPNVADLNDGLNLIGHYQEDQQSVERALSSVAAGENGEFSDTVFTVLRQDQDSGAFTYESFGAGEFETLEPGEAYWVVVTDEQSYTEAPFTRSEQATSPNMISDQLATVS